MLVVRNWVEESMSKYDNDKPKIHWSSEEDTATLLKMVIEEYKKKPSNLKTSWCQFI